MNEELLEKATSALRDEMSVDGASDGELGRRRLERALLVAPRRRKRRAAVLVLLAATFVGGAAWASVSGRAPSWFHLASETAPAGSASTGALPRDGRSPPPVLAAATVSATPDQPSPILSASSERAVEPEPGARLGTPTPPPVPRPRSSAAHRFEDHGSVAALSADPPSAPSAPDSADLDSLFREASNAQFVRKDPSAALAAWDHYLAAAGPSGRMALEARYNRATTLVRLGRTREAREALEPFARGEYGGYRRDDATRLIDALDR